ncbi:MAG: SPASM domain-containing protein, partial [Candidatus Omnitrophota bacterium]
MAKPRIILHVVGEPLLNKNLFEMIKYAKNKGCLVTLHTNATLLTKEMSIRMLQSPPDFISFSFDAASPEVYEKLRVGAKFEQVKAQIESFLKMRHEMKQKIPFTRIEMISLEDTEKYIPDFVNYWQANKVDQVAIRMGSDWLGLVDIRGGIKRRYSGSKPCRLMFFSCAILVDGTVVPCCRDIAGRVVLGNIFKQKFHEIWNGDVYNRLRINQLRNTISENSICFGCSCAWLLSIKEKNIQRLLMRFIERNAGAKER